MAEFSSFIITGLKEIFHNMFELFLFNVMWFLFTILVITAPPATAALFYTTNELAHNRSATWRTFFSGMKLYFWSSWKWGILNIIVAVLFFSNVVFYASIEKVWAEWARGGISALYMFWVFVQLYVFPIAFEQDEPNLRNALRNSLVLMVKRPMFYLGTAFILLVLALISSIFVRVLWGILSAGVIAFLVNRTTIYLIDDLEGRGDQA